MHKSYDYGISALANEAFLAAIQPGADDYQSILTRFGTVERLLQELR